VRPEWALILTSYLSSPMVDHCLHVWPIFSYVMPYFGGLAIRFYTCVFSKHLCFFTLWVFAVLLSGLCSIFVFIPEMIVLCKLFTKLCCCSTLCSFLRCQVVNCSQCSYIMLLSKLTLGTAKPWMRPEEALCNTPIVK
jgi:hypothetical protein